MWGGGTRWRPKPSSPLPKWRIQDLSHKKVVKSGGFGSNPRIHHMGSKVADGPYVAVTWPCATLVQNSHFSANSSTKDFCKKLFQQNKCGDLISWLHKCQNSPTSFLWAVKSNTRVVSHLWCEHFYRLLSSRCDTEKGGGKGKGHRIDKQNEVNSCAAWGYLVSHGLRKERSAYQSHPPPHTPPKRIMDRSW